MTPFSRDRYNTDPHATPGRPSPHSHTVPDENTLLISGTPTISITPLDEILTSSQESHARTCPRGVLGTKATIWSLTLMETLRGHCPPNAGAHYLGRDQSICEFHESSSVCLNAHASPSPIVPGWSLDIRVFAKRSRPMSDKLIARVSISSADTKKNYGGAP